MDNARSLVLKEEAEKLSQPDLVIVFCAALAALDDEHLEHALCQIADDDLGTLTTKGIVEQREREQGYGEVGQ